MSVTRSKLSHFTEQFEVTGNWTGPIVSTGYTITGVKRGNKCTLFFSRLAALANGVALSTINFSAALPSRYRPLNSTSVLASDPSSHETQERLVILSGDASPNGHNGRRDIGSDGLLRVGRNDGNNFSTNVSLNNGFRPFSITYEVAD